MTENTQSEGSSGISSSIIALIILVGVVSAAYLIKSNKIPHKPNTETPIVTETPNNIEPPIVEQQNPGAIEQEQVQDNGDFHKTYCDQNQGTLTKDANGMDTCTLKDGQIIQFGDQTIPTNNDNEATKGATSEVLPANPVSNENENISTSNLNAEEAQIKADEETLAKDFKGLTLEEANKLAESKGLETRVTSLNGEAKAVTADLRMNRINFDIVNDKVENVTLG